MSFSFECTSSALSQVIQLQVHFELVLNALSQNVFAYNCERSLNLPMYNNLFESLKHNLEEKEKGDVMS